MSKIVNAPDKFRINTEKGKPERFIANPWPGSVTIADPLTMLHVEAIENAMEIQEEIQGDQRVYLTVVDKPKLSAIAVCVEAWNLQGFPEQVTAENFPLSPRKASHDLITWLWVEILKVYTGELEVPNE